MLTDYGMAFSQLEEFSDGRVSEGPAGHLTAQVRLDQSFEQGYQRGLEIGRMQAAADYDERMGILRAQADATLQQEKRAWQEASSEQIAAVVGQGLSSFCQGVEKVVAELLKPWLKDKLLRQAVDRFHETLDRAVTEAAVVEISGPEIFVRSLQRRLASRCATLLALPNENMSVTVKVEDTVISANFSAWSAQLERLNG